MILNTTIHEIKKGGNNFGKYLTQTLHQDKDFKDFQSDISDIKKRVDRLK